MHPNRLDGLLAMLMTLGVFAAPVASAAERGPLSPSKAKPAVRNDAVPANSETRLIERRAERLQELPPAPTPPTVESPTAGAIDQFLVASWSDLGSHERPSGLCDDATFARRAFLDLIGVIPTLIELNHFLVDSSAQKRIKLIDQLLARRTDYATHWLPFWEDALASQTVMDQGGVPTRGNYRLWLLDSFAANKPYDVLVAELLDPSMPGRQPARNEDIFGVKHTIEYVRNEDLTVTLQTAANVGQVFLSTSMKCASCHDHFENPEWTQNRFLGFAGLFAPRDLERVRCDVHSGQIVPARFPYDVSGAPAKTPTKLAERLNLAARLITDPANERFSKSIVNRLWRRFFGLGLFEPIDDYRPERGVSHPELLNWLARDFMEHGYDLQHTIRLILASRAYQAPFVSRWADRFDPAAPNAPRYFRSPGLRRLSAEQAIDSIRMATAGEVGNADRACFDSRVTELSLALGKPASRNEISTARSGEAAVVQSLELLNGAELEAMIDASVLFDKPLRKQDLKRLTDRLYHLALSRPASNEEKRLGQLFLAGEPELEDAVKDMYWALFASPEFQFIK